MLILQKSQLFDFHHFRTKKMVHNISVEQENIFSVNLINIDIFLSSWYEITPVTTKVNSM